MVRPTLTGDGVNLVNFVAATPRDHYVREGRCQHGESRHRCPVSGQLHAQLSMLTPSLCASMISRSSEAQVD